MKPKSELKEAFGAFFVTIAIAIGILLIVAALVACTYKPDHRSWPQTQSGNINCDPKSN